MSAPLLELDGVVRRYTTRKGLFGKRLPVHAVDGISLSLRAGETLFVRTAILKTEGKTLRYRHWLFSGTGEPACAAEGAALLFDKATRKAVPLPEPIRQRL